jgi:TolB-like protein/DNA-binding winged helix-turn-helix (wHTH) protein
MALRFEDFELDEDQAELRRGGERVHLEPQALAVLALLVRQRERMVPKEEIVEVVWQGRAVSDSALSSRIKSIRAALADSGREQRLVRTLHGRGFRFVGVVEEVPDAPSAGAASVATGAGSVAATGEAAGDIAASEPALAANARPSIAVLPFRLVGVAGPYATIADALPHELIAELARLRWLFVIARGSSFRFRAADVDVAEVGRALGVRYCLGGTVEVRGHDLGITVELADTRDAAVVWAERYATAFEGLEEVRTRIVASIIAALEVEIPAHEARHARAAAAETLDAWGSYHLGLHHMYRFTAEGNATAGGHFRRAVELEPEFARAWAGLSFTRFQDAFLRYTDDVPAATDDARRMAERGVELDGKDPFVNFAMGRSFWLSGELDTSAGWLDRAIALSPNYAQGVYASAWTAAVAGHADQGQERADLAMALSPLDPLYYGMLGARAFAHIVRGEFAEGRDWAERSARAPGAHVMIRLIAVAACELAGDRAAAAQWLARAGRQRAGVRQEEFFRCFPFSDPATRAMWASALARHGV